MRYSYYDNNGTTIMDKNVRESMSRYIIQGNPSAKYPDALMARETINVAKAKLMDYCRISDKENYKVIFTSGASESNNFVFNALTESYLKFHHGICTKKAYIITSEIEHKTSINRCANLAATNIVNVKYIKPNKLGVIDEDDVINMINHILYNGEDIIVVSIMHVNNETGNYNRLKRIIKYCDERNIFFHSDIVASFGKCPYFLYSFSHKPAAVSISFHKLFGPTQCGALIIKKKFLEYDSDDITIKYKIGAMISGTQYDGYRGGTENVSLIVGSLVAMEISFHDRYNKNLRLINMRNHFLYEMKQLNYRIVHYSLRNMFNESGNYLIHFTNYSVEEEKNYRESIELLNRGEEPNITSPHVVNFCLVRYTHIGNIIKPVNNFFVLDELLKKNIIISTGSACNLTEKSYVIESLNVPEYMYKNPLRISFGDINFTNQSTDEIFTKIRILASEINNIVKRS